MSDTDEAAANRRASDAGDAVPTKGLSGIRGGGSTWTRLLVLLVVAMVAANVYLWFDGRRLPASGQAPDDDAETVALGERIPVGGRISAAGEDVRSNGTLRVDDVEVGADVPAGLGEPDGQLVILDLVLENDREGSTVQLDTERLRVVDDQGRRHGVDTTEELWQEHSWLLEDRVFLAGDARTSGRLVLDIPVDAVPERLWVPDETTTSGVGDVLVELR
ncbi:hypothetical protein ACPYO6_03505 [Georgenia sp. Z1344]|uniref:hypothetical protein n=1 Tax=Georgenia sp. Z1344 TaxID=3416706 RepID=UPI003CEB3302